MRIPDDDYLCENYRLGIQPEDLPCGGCPYCQKAHSNWSYFADVVDDVVPLGRRKQVSEVTVSESDDDQCDVTHVDIMVHEDGPVIAVNGVTTDDAGTDVDLTSSNYLKKNRKRTPSSSVCQNG